MFDNPLESAIQTALVEYLHLMAPQRGFLFFSCANEAMGKAQSGAGMGRMMRLRRMGLRSGVADMVIVKDGRAYFLEMKRRLGKQSANQLEFEADAIRAGAEYAVAHSFDEALKILKNWEVLA
jgi:hypothetical protein